MVLEESLGFWIGAAASLSWNSKVPPAPNPEHVDIDIDTDIDLDIDVDVDF